MSTLVPLAALSVSVPIWLGAQGASAPPALSTSEIARRASPATVVVLAIGSSGDTIGQGSGFVIREDGVVVTNYHVLLGASRAVVVLPTGEAFSRVRVLDADSASDLALLKIPGAGMRFLPTRTSTPRVGERAVAIGTPLGLANTVSEGIVSASRVVDGREIIQLTAPLSPGSSGGPVLDAAGRVFAVATSYLEGGQQLNFAVPVRYAIGLLADGPSERSIAQVFADNGAQSSSPEPVQLSMRRASAPQMSFGGTFALNEETRDSAGRSLVSRVGFLLTTRDVGLLVLAQGTWEKITGATEIYRVARWSTNPSGDLLLSAGGVSWDGFQAEGGGFYAEGRISFERGEVTSVISASPYRLALSEVDGLYRARVRTSYRNRETVGTHQTDWSGDLAVAFGRDSIFVNLYLTNESGGNTSFYASGPVKEGQKFDLTDPSGSRLTGSVRDGLLVAEWVDQRDGGRAFFGQLRAERQ